MGDLSVQALSSPEAKREFLNWLLRDVRAMEIMLENDLFESSPLRIGAEQELCVIDRDYDPSFLGPDILASSTDPHLTSEIARFNLEINLDPFELKDRCFRQSEDQLREQLGKVVEKAANFGQGILLTGILPTINRYHLEMKYMTPLDRYYILSEVMRKFRGGAFEIHIQGVDDLITSLDSVLFEGCNTSFQMHLQIPAGEFVDQYNWAQQIAGPVLSICTNSPLLLGRELWMETRIALFRQSLDMRTSTNHLREKQARVFFGSHWLEHSPVDLFKEHIARFPLLLTREVDEDSLEALNAGKAPRLRALSVHNGTVYNWNRPCYGRNDGKPHLRIENRYIPSGPTPLDEISNFAFWVGLMKGAPEGYHEFYRNLPFEYAKDNFYRAARNGLEAILHWSEKRYTPKQLILEVLLPAAEKGLKSCAVDPVDIERYLSVIEKRTHLERTGASWQVENFRRLKADFGLDVALTELTKAMYELQVEDQPLHEWPRFIHQKVHPYNIDVETRIGAIMSTDLFTVREDEPLVLVNAIMEWKIIRHLPVENQAGELVGIITARDILSLREKGVPMDGHAVEEWMNRDLVTVDRTCPLGQAIEKMKFHGIGCLPVIHENKLLGLVTDTDLKRLHLW